LLKYNNFPKYLHGFKSSQVGVVCNAEMADKHFIAPGRVAALHSSSQQFLRCQARTGAAHVDRGRLAHRLGCSDQAGFLPRTWHSTGREGGPVQSVGVQLKRLF